MDGVGRWREGGGLVVVKVIFCAGGNKQHADIAISSGMLYGLVSGLKFIPYMPAINVRGIKIVAIMVSTFITSFIRLLAYDIYISCSPKIISR